MESQKESRIKWLIDSGQVDKDVLEWVYGLLTELDQKDDIINQLDARIGRVLSEMDYLKNVLEGNL